MCVCMCVCVCECVKCFECQVFHINKTTRFFKTVIFRILRVFNRLSQTENTKRYILPE